MNINEFASYCHFHLFCFIYQFIILLNPIFNQRLNYSFANAADDLFSARCLIMQIPVKKLF